VTLLINVVRIVHVGIAAAWFGHKLLIPADIASSLDEREAAESLVERLHRAETLGIVTGLGTLLTGLALVVMLGPGTVSPAIYVGLALVGVAIGVGATVARPASIALRATVAAGDLSAARLAAGRLTSVLRTEGILWSGALITMLI
jgi:hypothetical protein